MNNISIDELRNVIALTDLPDDQLQWLLDHSQYVDFYDGDVVVSKGDPIDYMWMVLEGSAAYYMDINGNKVFYYSFGNDNATGGIGGLLPYSRMTVSPGYAYANGKVRTLQLHKKYFPELEKMNSAFTKKLIAYMTDRARTFATIQLQHEKVSALGKLSAGIAHELNNPASAINRISHELTNRLIRNFDLTENLLYHGVKREHIRYLRKMLEDRVAVPTMTTKLTTMQQLELEDDIREWLEYRKVSRPGEMSETFVETGVTPMELEQICNLVGDAACGDVLGWLENLVSSQKIINDLESASTRISTLVGAIKSHVHMDRTGGFERTGIKEDIENSLTLLGHKIREKNIQVTRKYIDNVPPVEAVVGELNQVWMNLIDNAIFAVGKGGQVTIEIFRSNDDVKVNIIDNGPGIDPGIIHQIFDPFFTTKKVGEGTGIGLDIVARIVKHHQGDIKTNSVPGRTEFSVCIPVNQKKEVE
jgi:signal transduction histidine kinase